MDKGYLPISRQLFVHELWTEPRTYSRLEAWLDLLQSASWQDGNRLVKGKVIALKRGQLIGSLRFLGSRWSWSPMKVQRYIDTLKTETMVSEETRQGETILTIVKYETYNQADFDGETGGPEKTRRRRDSRETAARQSKEGKEGKGEANASPCDQALYRPSREELTLYVIEHLQRTKQDADHVWNVWIENGWTRSAGGGRRVPIKFWKMALNTWNTGNYFPSQRGAGRRQQEQEPPAVRQVKLAPELIEQFLTAHPEYRNIQPTPPTRDTMPPSMQADWDTWYAKNKPQ